MAGAEEGLEPAVAPHAAPASLVQAEEGSNEPQKRPRDEEPEAAAEEEADADVHAKRRRPDAESGSAQPRVSLALWLTSAGEQTDLGTLPWPTTCAAARVEDRNSVFVGYVYPLTTSSTAAISALLSHLTRVVHPTIPASALPPQFRNSAPSRRGSTHDMYAFRVMQLKPGRTGLGGPSDFGTEQGQEDDGEQWGSDKVMRVVRELGASDVLVIVSRWYGGELLGPVRFDHITHCARAALQQHLENERLAELREQLQQLDARIQKAREALGSASSGPAQTYADLSMDRAKRLLLARSKALDALERRAAEQSGPPAPPQH